jgi:hypothetical protein
MLKLAEAKDFPRSVTVKHVAYLYLLIMTKIFAESVLSIL